MLNTGLVKPAHLSRPEAFKTYGPEVADLCDSIGFAPDAQQRFALDIIFGRRADGQSSAFEIAIIAPRQQLKTGCFKQAAIGWLFLFDEHLVVWSAHEFTTASEAFRDLEELITGSDYLRAEVKAITHGTGKEGIELNSGARLIFKTRTKGGGRGLAGRKVILDEAHALREMHMGALVPLLSAQPDPQLLYGAAGGMADSAIQRDVRDRGRANSDPRLGYMEWCAPDPEIACDAGKACTHAKTAVGCGCDKPDMWLPANPAIAAGRTSLEYIAAERKALPASEFTRERMVWWDDPIGGSAPMSVTLWHECGDRESTIAASSPIALAIDVAPDRSMSAISVAGWRDDGLPHGEIAEFLPGTGWLMDRLTGIVGRRDPCVVVLDPSQAAGALEKDLRLKKTGPGPDAPPMFVFVTKLPEKPLILQAGQHLVHLASSRDYAQACGNLTDHVTNGEFRHPDQAPLNSAVEAARSRPLSGAWVWNSSTGGESIAPLVAVTLAQLGLMMYGQRKTPMPFALI
jgi:hypothetical protein